MSLLSRRGLLAASAVATAASVFSTTGPALANTSREEREERARRRDTVPPPNRGIILYTVRDVVSRTPDPATGLQGGFRFVFEQLSAIGYKQVEFAGYNQSTAILGRQITAAEIRQLLDDNGLVANGSHITFNFANPATFDAQLDIAQTLGMKHLGTAAIPTTSRYKDDWKVAADNFNAFGAKAAARGIKLYQHNHHAEYNFLLDAGPLDANGKPTASSGLRALDYFFTLVDPKLVWFEMDIYWAYVARHRYQTYTDKRGNVRTDLFDPIRTVKKRSHQFPLFHVKDGVPADVPDGYTMVPAGTGAIPLHEFLDAIGDQDYRHPNYEQDNAPGGTAAPGQSLQFSQQSYTNIASWRRQGC